MNLPANPPISGHITEAINHFNNALDLKDQNSPSVDVAHLMFSALNKLQTEWRRCQSEPPIGQVNTFKKMIMSSLPLESRGTFLQTTQIRNLVTLEPMIMDHDILRHKDYSNFSLVAGRL